MKHSQYTFIFQIINKSCSLFRVLADNIEHVGVVGGKKGNGSKAKQTLISHWF
jgi:hypothetical protein